MKEKEKTQRKKQSIDLQVTHGVEFVHSMQQKTNIIITERKRDCIERLCKDFRELAEEIVNYEKKEMILLTDEETEFYEKQKVCHIYKKEFSTDKNDKNKFKLHHKVRDHCH